MSDNLTAVSKYKNSLLAQFAAESYLDNLTGDLKEWVIDTENQYADPETLTGRLALGANSREHNGVDSEGHQFTRTEDATWSATLATKGMLDDFGKTWVVVDQIANTASGFSATLLKSLDKDGHYTLSFRSTESKVSLEGGDVERDSDGANTEISSTGLAWAQIWDRALPVKDMPRSIV